MNSSSKSRLSVQLATHRRRRHRPRYVNCLIYCLAASSERYWCHLRCGTYTAANSPFDYFGRIKCQTKVEVGGRSGGRHAKDGDALPGGSSSSGGGGLHHPSVLVVSTAVQPIAEERDGDQDVESSSIIDETPPQPPKDKEVKEAAVNNKNTSSSSSNSLSLLLSLSLIIFMCHRVVRQQSSFVADQTRRGRGRRW